MRMIVVAMPSGLLLCLYDEEAIRKALKQGGEIRKKRDRIRQVMDQRLN